MDEKKDQQPDNKGKHDQKKKHGKGQNNRFKRKKSKNKTSTDFKGETNELSGNVFKTFLESKNTTQYENTLKALQVYVASNFRNGGDIVWMLKHEDEFIIEQPTAPAVNQRSTRQNDKSYQVEIDIYKENVKMYVMRKNRYQENKEKLYSVIRGQCSDAMQSKLQSKSRFAEMDEERDCLKLLNEIKAVMFNFETQQYPDMSMHLACQKYFNFKQMKYKSVTDYYKRFKTTIKVL